MKACVFYFAHSGKSFSYFFLFLSFQLEDYGNFKARFFSLFFFIFHVEKFNISAVNRAVILILSLNIPLSLSLSFTCQNLILILLNYVYQPNSYICLTVDVEYPNKNPLSGLIHINIQYPGPTVLIYDHPEKSNLEI